MIKRFLLCSAVLVSSLMAQTTFDDGAGDSTQPIYLEQITSFDNTATLEKARIIFIKWENYFRFDTDLFNDNGILIFTLGEADSSTELKLSILFEDTAALQRYMDDIESNSGLKNETSFEGENWKTNQTIVGLIPKSMLDSKLFLNHFDGATVKIEPISKFQFGPFVQGWLNYPASTYTQHNAIVNNVAFIGFDAGSVELMREFIDQLETFLEAKGMFGTSLLRWKVWNNEIGMTATAVYDGVEGWKNYNAAIGEFCHNKTICDQWNNSTIQTFDQFIAVNSQMSLEPLLQPYTNPGNPENFHGIPNLDIYGDAHEFGVIMDLNFVKPGIKQIYLSVPVFNGIAAYMNYVEWTDTSNEWSLVMYAEVWNACISLTGLVGSLLFNDSILVDFARVGILSEFVTLFLAYTAYTESNPNGDAMKTSTLLSFLSVATGVIGGIFVQLLA